MRRIFTDVQTGILRMEAYRLADAEAVLPRVRAGDPAAQEAVYRAFESPVYHLARRICRTTEDAEDVMQETFLEVFRSIGQFRGDGSLWGWIRTITASKALMRLRRNKYRDTEELHDELAPLRRDDAALRMDLEAALERLSETSRAVVWLHDVEGYTHEEIAQMMDRTVSFSKSQLARAHARLRRWLGEEIADVGENEVTA
jgi:RNA polymerase sigma-70 factor (ECF subfamily)